MIDQLAATIRGLAHLGVILATALAIVVTPVLVVAAIVLRGTP